MLRSPVDLFLDKKFSLAELMEALRISIIAELDAINLYLQFARTCGDESIKRVLRMWQRKRKPTWVNSLHCSKSWMQSKHYNFKLVKKR